MQQLPCSGGADGLGVPGVGPRAFAKTTASAPRRPSERYNVPVPPAFVDIDIRRRPLRTAGPDVDSSNLGVSITSHHRLRRHCVGHLVSTPGSSSRHSSAELMHWSSKPSAGRADCPWAALRRSAIRRRRPPRRDCRRCSCPSAAIEVDGPNRQPEWKSSPPASLNAPDDEPAFALTRMRRALTRALAAAGPAGAGGRPLTRLRRAPAALASGYYWWGDAGQRSELGLGRLRLGEPALWVPCASAAGSDARAKSTRRQKRNRRGRRNRRALRGRHPPHRRLSARRSAG